MTWHISHSGNTLWIVILLENCRGRLTVDNARSRALKTKAFSAQNCVQNEILLPGILIMISEIGLGTVEVRIQVK